MSHVRIGEDMVESLLEGPLLLSRRLGSVGPGHRGHGWALGPGLGPGSGWGAGHLTVGSGGMVPAGVETVLVTS